MMKQLKFHLFLLTLMASLLANATESSSNLLLANPIHLPTFTKDVVPLTLSDMSASQIIKMQADVFVARWWATGYQAKLMGLVSTTPIKEGQKNAEFRIELDASSLLKSNLFSWSERTSDQKIYLSGLYAYFRSSKEDLADQELFKQRSTRLFSCMEGASKIQSSISTTVITKMTISDGFQKCSDGLF